MDNSCNNSLKNTHLLETSEVERNLEKICENLKFPELENFLKSPRLVLYGVVKDIFEMKKFKIIVKRAL